MISQKESENRWLESQKELQQTYLQGIKDCEERFMAWQQKAEERMWNAYQERLTKEMAAEDKRRQEERDHQLKLFTLIGQMMTSRQPGSDSSDQRPNDKYGAPKTLHHSTSVPVSECLATNHHEGYNGVTNTSSTVASRRSTSREPESISDFTLTSQSSTDLSREASPAPQSPYKPHLHGPTAI